MPRFLAHSPDTAPQRSAEILDDLVQRHGGAGLMVRTMAGSPSTLRGYLELSSAMKRSQLDRRISERISLAVQAWLDCHLCLQAHTDAALALGVSEAEVALAKEGRSSQPRIDAILQFAQRVHVDPSSLSDDDVEVLGQLGFSDREILDVVGLVALNVLTGSFNLLAGLEVSQ